MSIGVCSSTSPFVQFTRVVSDLLSSLVFRCCCCLKMLFPTNLCQPPKACWVWQRHLRNGSRSNFNSNTDVDMLYRYLLIYKREKALKWDFLSRIVFCMAPFQYLLSLWNGGVFLYHLLKDWTRSILTFSYPCGFLLFEVKGKILLVCRSFRKVLTKLLIRLKAFVPIFPLQNFTSNLKDQH